MGVIRELGPTKSGERRWQVIVSAARRPDGTYGRITKTVVGTKRAARQMLAEIELDLAKRPRERELLVNAVTVEQLLRRWLTHAEEFEGRSPSTLREYRRLVAVELIPAFGHLRLEDLAVRHLEDLYRRLLRRGLTAASVRRVHAVIRRSLSQAVKWELASRNVALFATQPPEQQREPTPPSAQLVRAVIEVAFAQDRDGIGLLVRLAAATGMRRGELVALRWQHVDFHRGTLRVDTSAFEHHGERIEKSTKNRSVRVVTLDKATVAALHDARTASQQCWKSVGATWMNTSHIFEVLPGRPWSPNLASMRWHQVRAQVDGADGVRLHDLRHWQATVLLDAGVPLPTVAARLGHRDLTTTGRIYAHRTQRADEQAALVVETLLTQP